MRVDCVCTRDAINGLYVLLAIILHMLRFSPARRRCRDPYSKHLPQGEGNEPRHPTGINGNSASRPRSANERWGMLLRLQYRHG